MYSLFQPAFVLIAVGGRKKNREVAVSNKVKVSNGVKISNEVKVVAVIVVMGMALLVCWWLKSLVTVLTVALVQ